MMRISTISGIIFGAVFYTYGYSCEHECQFIDDNEFKNNIANKINFEKIYGINYNDTYGLYRLSNNSDNPITLLTYVPYGKINSAKLKKYKKIYYMDFFHKMWSKDLVLDSAAWKENIFLGDAGRTKDQVKVHPGETIYIIGEIPYANKDYAYMIRITSFEGVSIHSKPICYY